MNRRKQQGVIFLLIVLGLLGIGAAALFVGLGTQKSASQRQIDVAISAETTLQAAKIALIGTAVGGFNGGSRPGQFPEPDTLRNGIYDGKLDGGSCLDGGNPDGVHYLIGQAAMQSANLRCVGRLPWKTMGMDLQGVDDTDANGLVPWYAVSENLVDPGTICMMVLNPLTAAGATTSYNCPTSTGPAWPWLKVCDETGKLLSDRVAVVLIAPGSAIQTQGRTQQRPNGGGVAKDFLDGIDTPAGWASLPADQRCNSFDNAGLTGEFVRAPTSETFNDKLTYITIDELMLEVEKRVVGEAREALITFRSAIGSYPWLAGVSNLTGGLSTTDASLNVTAGFLPFHSANDQLFSTELSWRINTPASSDSVSPATSTSPRFQCYGSTYQCRIRTSGGLTIPRSVTAADFAALKISQVTSPPVFCKWTSDKKLDCNSYTYTQTTPVTYQVQRRPCTTYPSCSGTWVSVANYVGTQTRTITLQVSALASSANAVYVSANALIHASRSITSSSTFDTNNLLAAVDTWQPNSGIGVAPFDQFTPLQTGSASTNGPDSVMMSSIRRYPVFPVWYADNKWYEFIWATLSPDVAPNNNAANCTSNCLTVGQRQNVDIAVVSAGPPLSGQNRYTGNPTVNDFLEAPNNSQTVFSDFSAKRSATYADTVVTIPR